MPGVEMERSRQEGDARPGGERRQTLARTLDGARPAVGVMWGAMVSEDDVFVPSLSRVVLSDQFLTVIGSLVLTLLAPLAS